MIIIELSQSRHFPDHWRSEVSSAIFLQIPVSRIQFIFGHSPCPTQKWASNRKEGSSLQSERAMATVREITVLEVLDIETQSFVAFISLFFSYVYLFSPRGFGPEVGYNVTKNRAKGTGTERHCKSRHVEFVYFAASFKLRRQTFHGNTFTVDMCLPEVYLHMCVSSVYYNSRVGGFRASSCTSNFEKYHASEMFYNLDIPVRWSHTWHEKQTLFLIIIHDSLCGAANFVLSCLDYFPPLTEDYLPRL